MAPIKFEEHIKDKLREREIKPSASAWDKISSSLETPEKQKRTSFFWYGIAAGFIGLLLVSIFFFKSGNPSDIKQEDKIVEIEEFNIKQDKSKETTPVLKVEEEEKYVETETSEQESIIEKDSNEMENILNKETLAQSSRKDALENQPKKIPDVSEKLIEAKLAEIVAQADIMEENSDVLTDAEVDSLLRKAQREILTDKLLRKDNTVDAMALLSDVESELDQSFRDQIFEKLKTGFFKVRTAVADRNN